MITLQMYGIEKLEGVTFVTAASLGHLWYRYPWLLGNAFTSTLIGSLNGNIDLNSFFIIYQPMRFFLRDCIEW